jgi:ectoine hydroxylase-related dioxygenase (phytanoyl-CoA dioxygenase family)
MGFEVLPQTQRVWYQTAGYVGPFSILGTQELAEYQAKVERDLLCSYQSHGKRVDSLHSRHLDIDWVYDVCAHPGIVGRVLSLIGDSILLYTSQFFVKEPGGGEIPWHQDRDYLFVDQPLQTVCAWVALSHTTLYNGCLEFIPGSHKINFPHRTQSLPHLFNAVALFDKSTCAEPVSLSMKAGEVVLFHANILHKSRPNLTPERRIGLAARYVAPHVRIDHEAFFPTHRAQLLHGEDTLGINKVDKRHAR